MAGADLDRIKLFVAMARAMRGVPMAARRALGHEVAQVLHSAPPGADKIAFAREVLARHDAGAATYADRIILDACSRLDVLRITLDLIERAKA